VPNSARAELNGAEASSGFLGQAELRRESFLEIAVCGLSGSALPVKLARG